MLTPPCLSFWVNLSLKKKYLTCEGHFWLLPTKASFYRFKLSKKDEIKYAIATSAATNVSFQYNISLYQSERNFTLNHKRGVAAVQSHIACNRYYATDVRYI